MTQETRYSVSWFGPDEIMRAEDNILECPVQLDGSPALDSADSGTVTVYDEAGTAIVSAAAVTITSGIAVYTLTAATVPSTLSLSDRWQVVWALTIDGTDYVFKRKAALVRSRIYPVVCESDMTTLHFELRLWVDQHDQSLQQYIDGAWKFLYTWLRNQGKRPYLVLESTALFEPHLDLALALAFADMALLTSNDKYLKYAEDYRKRYDEARSGMEFAYDYDEDGFEDVDEGAQPAESVVFLCKPGNRYLETV